MQASFRRPEYICSRLYPPYPEFTTISQSNVTLINGTRERVGTRLDNALYATVTKRTSHGLEFRVAATYQHVEDEQTLLNAGDPVTSLIKYDDSQPNRYLVGDLVYDLPKLNVNHALGYVVNGWRWSHSLNWQAGTSIAVPAGAFSTGISPVTHHQSLTHWFNTCYIPVVANVGQTYNGVVQTSPVYGPPTNCQYTWAKANLYDSSTGQGYDAKGGVTGQYTYNYGFAMRAGAYQGSNVMVPNIANYVFNNLTNDSGTSGGYNILPNYGQGDLNNSGFNGILILGVGDANNYGYIPSAVMLAVQANMNQAWAERNGTTTLVWNDWEAGTPSTGTYFWDDSAAMAGLLDIPPTD